MADPAAAGAELSAGPTLQPVWRGIEALGEVVGGYCWLERRLFELTGSWASAGGEGAVPPEVLVFLAAASRRHGSLAERWAARLPVRAGVDPSALLESPPGVPRDVASEFSGTGTGAAGGLAALVEMVLPWLAGEYGAHLQTASPVSEAPVMEVLVEARRVAVGEMRGGGQLLRRLGATGLKEPAAGEA